MVMLTRDDILAVYAAGPDAVVALIESLQVAHAQQLAALTARVEALEQQLAKNSHNSSKPPASDGLAKRTQSLRQPSGRAPGGQRGHRGTTLGWVAQPTRQCLHVPTSCRGCGADLAGVPVGDTQGRQVHDLPPLRLEVTEHVAQTKVCPSCDTLNAAAFPPTVGHAVQYGPQCKALALYLGQYQLLPFARTRQLLHDLFGHSPSTGTLAAWVQSSAHHLRPVEAAIAGALQHAPVVHFDETGWRIDRRLHWLHSASTPHLTLYAPHAKRGTQATTEIGLLPGFTGRAVHDAWPSYFAYDCAHALCNAHLLRELRFAHEQLHQDWANALSALLLELKQAVADATAQGQTRLAPRRLKRFKTRYQALLERGWQANPPPVGTGRRGRPKQGVARNLLQRLTQRQSHVLAFADDFAVPFDNNLAERDLRMAKVQQKVSGCFRSPDGASAFCRIRGYISTLRKQQHDVLKALRSVFEHQPLMPALTP